MLVEARLMQKLSSHPNLVTFYRSVPLLSPDYLEETLMSGSTSAVKIPHPLKEDHFLRLLTSFMTKDLRIVFTKELFENKCDHTLQ